MHARLGWKCQIEGFKVFLVDEDIPYGEIRPVMQVMNIEKKIARNIQNQKKHNKSSRYETSPSMRGLVARCYAASSIVLTCSSVRLGIW